MENLSVLKDQIIFFENLIHENRELKLKMTMTENDLSILQRELNNSNEQLEISKIEMDEMNKKIEQLNKKYLDLKLMNKCWWCNLKNN